MTHLFRFRLLGSVQIEQDGEPLQGFKSRKTLALLGYLASESQPVPRDFLADLFWPDLAEDRSRNNLSQALHNISTLWSGCFVADRQTIQFCCPTSTWLDIKVFDELVARGEVSSLVMAADLYRGEFMAGMYLDDCPEFEQWLRLEQEIWRRRVTQVLRNLVAHYTSRSKLEQALQFSSRLLVIDPGDEEGHRQKMLLLAQSGQRSAALAQFDTCHHFLVDELGVEPTKETIKLYEQIRAVELNQEAQLLEGQKNGSPTLSPVHVVSSLAFNNLPIQATSFIGRETELALIDRYLANPTRRLITIVGLGGIGKTRLAIEAAAATGNFRHGVCFIPLTATNSVEFLVSTIADALNFPLYGRGEPKAQLMNYLNEKEMLLVMDNFEHLVAGAGLLVEILQCAPQIKILVTSRERLGLQEEWVLDLQGLPFPENEDSLQIENYSAVQLFLQRAQQVGADFWLRFLDKPAVTRICRLVEGLPLGIELAAAWTRTLSCQEIAAEIEKNYNFLTTSFQNIPERHQSMQAVFEHSWQFLLDEEKRVFRKLSIFRRGFSRKSAEQVAGASALLLSALVDKSLLRWTSADRYEMHELLRQYGATKLAEDPKEKDRVHYLHCKHYAAFLQEQEVHLKAGNQKEALEAISREIENVRAGWHWAITHRRAKEIEQYLESLFFFYNMQSRFQEGEAVFRQAATSLRKANGLKADSLGNIDRILGQVLARQGLFCASLGDYEKARGIMREGLGIFQNPDIRRDAPLSLNYLGAISLALGEYQEARQLCQECLMIAQERGDRWKEALALEYLGLIAISRSDYANAKELAQRSLAVFREFGYGSGIAGSLNILGIVARNLGGYAAAKKLCQESLVIAQEIGDRWEEALSLQYLSRIAISQGEYVEAKELAERSLAIYRKFDYTSGIALSLNLLGNAARYLGQYTEAKQLLQEVWQACQVLNYPLGTNLASYSLGYLAYLLGNYGEAQRWLTASLETAHKLAYQHGLIRSLNALGKVACALGGYKEARAYLYEALKVTQKIQAAPMILEVLTSLADLLIKEGRTVQAVELLTFPLGHAASKKETRDKASRLFTELAAKLPGQVIAAAQEKGKVDKLEERVAEILTQKMGEEALVLC
jgi:predicted ATPase/DNA-binding SARP family transcriptional activator